MFQAPNVGVGGKDFGGNLNDDNKESDHDVFLECVRIIKRWPSMNAQCFPVLPKHCNFVICAPYDGQYKLNVIDTLYFHKEYVKAKKAI